MEHEINQKFDEEEEQEDERDRYLRLLAKSRRENVLANIKAAEELYKLGPLDAQNLKKWGSALLSQACSIPAENEQILQSLRDAKSKLEEALELDKEDHELKFKLAMSYYYIVKKDTSLKQYDDIYMELCHKAIGFFKEVQEKAPEVYKSSMLEKMQDFLPIVWSDSEDEETDEMGEKPIMVLKEAEIEEVTMTRTQTKLHIANLPHNTHEHDIEMDFEQFGPIVDVVLIIPSRPPNYAFVEFENSLDAESAIVYWDGAMVDGQRLTVSFVHDEPRGNPSESPMRKAYKAEVLGLPSNASWQELKKLMSSAGDVSNCEVFPDESGSKKGIVDYKNRRDLYHAIVIFNDSVFRNSTSESVITVREYKSRYSQKLCRSHSRSKSPVPTKRRNLKKRSCHNRSSRSERAFRSPSRSFESPVPSRDNPKERSRSKSKG